MNIHSSFQDISLSKIVEVSEAAREAAPKFEQNTGKPFIFFQRGEVGFDTPTYITNALYEAMQKGLTKYPKSGGEKWFKKAVLHMLHLEGLEVDKNHVICTHGGQEGLQLTFSLFRGSVTAGFGPCWSCMLDNIFPYSQTNFVPIPLRHEDGFQVHWDEVERVVKTADIFYFNTPHNPTGKVFSRDETERLSHICKKHGVLLVADEAYKDIVFDGDHFSALKLENTDVISVFSFSKSFAATGLRVGYTVSRNPDLISKLIKGEYTQTAGVATPLQYAFAEALNNDEERDKWFDMYLPELRARRDCLCDTLDPAFLTTKAQGAFYCFIDLNRFIPKAVQDRDQYLLDLFMRNGIAIVPGSAFGRDYSGYIRLSFSTLDCGLIEEGVRRTNELILSNV